MKKLLGILVLGLMWCNVGNSGSSDKIGMTHEFGVSIPIHYKYVEPTFVEHDTDFEDDPFESYGLTYNFKKLEMKLEILEIKQGLRWYEQRKRK